MPYKFEVTKRYLKDIIDHIDGPEYSIALYELATQFRSRAKYHNEDQCSWDTAYQLLLQILNELGIDPFED